MKRWIWMYPGLAAVLVVVGVVYWARAQASAPPKIQVGGFNCAMCHREIAADWAQSAHARAFTNEHYAQLKAAQPNPDACVSCHAPEKIHVSGIGPGNEPKARADLREEGISCIDCHEGEEAKNEFGPVADVTPPGHTATKSAEMTTSEFCATCHGTHPWFDTYGAWKGSRYAAEGGKTCQDCHMPIYSGKTTPLPASPQRDDLRRHTFPGTSPELLASAATVDAAAAQGSVTVTVTNSGTGHNLPGVTGRQCVVEVAVLDDAGNPTQALRQPFGWADYNAPDGGRLAPDESRSFAFDVGAATGKARVRLVYQAVAGDPQSEKVMLEKEVAL